MEAWIPLRPKPKGNRQEIVWVRGKPRVKPTKATQKAQAALATALRIFAPPEPFAGPVWRDASFVFPVPPSWPAWKRRAALELRWQHAIRPDVGNLIKLLDDALEQGGWLADDARIVGGTPAKMYGPEEGYLIRITPVPQASRTDPCHPFVRAPLLPKENAGMGAGVL